MWCSRRYMGDEEEPFDGFLIRGKFTNSSTATNWWCNIDGVKVDLAPYVNPETKEFEYWQKEKPTPHVSPFHIAFTS